MTDKKILLLRDNIIHQATYYLSLSGVFCPLGSVIDRNDKVQVISAFTGVDFPPSLSLIDLLQDRMNYGIKNGDYQLCAIGIDVYLNNAAALEIRVISENGIICNFHLPYVLENNNQVTFKDIIIDL